MMPRSPIFIDLTWERACVGDGRARIPLLSVLAGVIVGQGPKPRKNKCPLILVHLSVGRSGSPLDSGLASGAGLRLNSQLNRNHLLIRIFARLVKLLVAGRV